MKTPSTAVAGTALGLRRCGAPLDHDDDLDLAIDENDWNLERLCEAFRRDSSFVVGDNHPASKKLGVLHRSGCRVDIFKFYLSDSLVWHDGVFVRWWNSPFGTTTIDFLGQSVPIPSPVDRYLEECYGEWETPLPSFDAFVDAPNVEVTDDTYFTLYLIRRAYRRASYGLYVLMRDDLTRCAELLAGLPNGGHLLTDVGITI